MYCGKCGKLLAENARFCTSCGAKVADDKIVFLDEEDDETTGLLPENYPVPPAYIGEPTNMFLNSMSRKEFYNRVASKRTKGWVTAMVVVCFLTSAVSFVFLVGGNILGILDIAFYVTMGVLLLTTRHWAFTLTPTIYSTVFSLIGVAMGEAASGIFAIIAGIISTIALKKINKAYLAYRDQRVLPDREI